VNEEIVQPIGQYIAESVLKQPGRTIRPDEPLLSSGLVDSFSLMDLALYIEERFGVRIEDTELNSQTFDTLAQLAALVRSRQ
jgi:acyl carrier protein